MLECIPNVSEGRDHEVIAALADACGPSLVDVHRDPDHHRSVFTLAGRATSETRAAVRALALAVADHVDLTAHEGVHPRLGAIDVVPFVALGDTDPADAVAEARDFGIWIADTLAVPVFFYADADPDARSLPLTRREAFTTRAPDVGPDRADPRLGAVTVGARPPMVAVNVELASDDLDLARAIADEVRERDGGLRGVRALGLATASRGQVQVSMNLVDLAATGLEEACDAVRARAEAAGASVAGVELVGLLAASELARTSEAFRTWSGIGEDHTIEARAGRS